MARDDQHANRPPMLANDTEVFFDGRPSILLLVPPFLKAMLLATIAALVGWFVNWPVRLANPKGLFEGMSETGPSVEQILIITQLTVGLVSVTILIHGCIHWVATRYRITNDRIEYERGILSKTVLNVELWRVRDIFFRRSAIHFFLGLGVIDILATDDTIPKLEIGPIRHAREIYDKLKQARLESGRLAGAQAMGMSSSPP